MNLGKCYYCRIELDLMTYMILRGNDLCTSCYEQQEKGEILKPKCDYPKSLRLDVVLDNIKNILQQKEEASIILKQLKDKFL